MLEDINGPRDLDKLSRAELEELAKEIRDYLVESVSKTGGHLGPNLGVVELTMMIHKKFNSPHDKIVFDTGHQSYVHKLLTGRKDFTHLRQEGGISGYPDRAESEHDIVESSHASSSLSWADGISRAYQLQGDDRYVVVVIGDGALTGGMSWEALNNIAADKERKVVIVVNDNGRSYAPTVGGFADYLGNLRSTINHYRTTRTYQKFADKFDEKFADSQGVKKVVYKGLQGARKGVKDIFVPQGMFEDLGLMYIGPVDGHDIEDLSEALERAKHYNGPVIVHALTEKGHGYAHAVAHEGDQFHSVGVIDPKTGLSPETEEDSDVVPPKSWTSVFGDEIVKLADERKDIVGITAAMLQPVGFNKLQEKYPERVFDVGIAEQQAVASAAGMAYAGLHPVVAVYATFLNRAFDQLLMDVALHKAGVTFVLDRAGVTGPDGPSHHGMWDLSLAQIVPGVKIAAPRDAQRLKEEFREAVEVEDAPTIVRFAKGNVGPEIIATQRLDDGVDVLKETSLAHDVLMVTVGSMAEQGLEVAELVEKQGVGATVLDPRWVLPVPQSIIEMARDYRLVIVIEDGVRVGGVGSRIRQELRAAEVDTALNEIGLPAEFLAQGSREQVLDRVGMSVQDMADDVMAHVEGRKVPKAKAKKSTKLQAPTELIEKASVKKKKKSHSVKEVK
ncbi:MAG: 1-deoxy-D-xylulose-5-phosphate synthase [Micrococcaceae bacterium]